MQEGTSSHSGWNGEKTNVNAAAARTYDPQVKGSSIENLWVLLVAETGTTAGPGPGQVKTPMLARAGDGLYLLAFRTGFTARKFMTDSGVQGAEPRMVVGSVVPQILSSVEGKSVAGVLVDYDFTTNSYREAGLLF
jgi:hypothetical protein